MKPFRFKKFTIHQDQCAMKVGTDGILLGAWASLTKAKRILDIGTGTGLLALMAAQRNPKAVIHAVEIDHSAYSQACDNISTSPWHDRLSVFHAPIQVFDPDPDLLYDFILSNPPFFLSGGGAADEKRILARHDIELSFDELLENGSRLLSDGGHLALILPEVEGRLFIEKAIDWDLFPCRITEVKSRPGNKTHRLLIQLSNAAQQIENGTLVIHPEEDSGYSEAYTAITQDFYLDL
jgi:tRNA1Val (adenine37-N6)-methyltransferase